MEIALGLFALSLLSLSAVLAWWLKSRRPAEPPAPDIAGRLVEMRRVGQLSVFKLVTQEIVTQSDHSWGEFGAKYLSWILSKKKLAIIFEFEIDFRFDLLRPEFRIESLDDKRFRVHLPPCAQQVFIRNIQFYDEQKGRLLPWLLPDLVNGFLAAGFDEEDKNRLIAAARGHAEQQARGLIGDLQSEVRASAVATLQALASGFGAEEVEFVFDSGAVVALPVGVSEALAA
ncbi:MAG: DUF4230 domain-containing protein [Gammaproteobacteria bacterium]|nr:DUF4230 domain-containing protein [Gammaproteobacteria bacterium]